MRLILHIGTPKTGTTAVQQFLLVNRQKLSENGIYYATSPDKFNFNPVVAAHLRQNQGNIISQYFSDHLQNAKRKGCDTIVASAEALYCMERHLSRYEYKLGGAGFQTEQRTIVEIRAAIPEQVGCHIICYVRRPDHYLEALYNQSVKLGRFVGSVSEFANIVDSMTDYDRYLSVWQDVFGRGACEVRVYEAALPDVIHDFLRHVLRVRDNSLFVQPTFHVNERLNRDLLEYICLVNRDIPYSRRVFEEKIYVMVNKETAKSSRNHEYLSPDERAGLLSRLQPSMERLRKEFALPAFPQFDYEAAKAAWRPYPGLSFERRQEIECRYKVAQAQMGFRLERVSKRMASIARGRSPFLSLVLDMVRASGMRRMLLVALSHLK